MKQVFTYIFGFLLLSLAGCNFNIKRGNGDIEKIVTALDNFENLSIGGNYNVILVKNDDPGVAIETDENLHDFINVEVFNGTLNINNIHNLQGSEGIDIIINYSELNNIFSTGTSSIDNEGVLISDKLNINLSGAGTIELEVDVIELKTNLTGAGVMIVSGEADQLETHISGAGGLRAFELNTKNAEINVSGLGGVEVFANEKLVITITGLGGVIYAGNPSIIEKRITGFGKIKRANE